MSRVVDYAWGRPSTAALHAAGATAICRYLAFENDETRGKLLTAQEAAELNAAGFAVASNWEQAGSWPELSGGFNTGANHATEAARQHTKCGGSPDRPIYFSVDFDATDAQLPIIGDYFRGVASVIGLGRTGAYGGYKVIKYLLDHRLIRWAWQTFAWSAGLWDSRVHLHQIQNDVWIDNVSCDLNNSMTADFGQWGVGDSMDQTEKLIHPTPNAPGRDIGSTFTDLGNLRDYMIGADTVARGPVPGDPHYPTPDSLLGKLQAFLDHPPTTTITDAQAAAIADRIAAELNPRLAELEAQLAVVHAEVHQLRNALRAAAEAQADGLVNPPPPVTP